MRVISESFFNELVLILEGNYEIAVECSYCKKKKSILNFIETRTLAKKNAEARKILFHCCNDCMLLTRILRENRFAKKVKVKQVTEKKHVREKRKKKERIAKLPPIEVELNFD